MAGQPGAADMSGRLDALLEGLARAAMPLALVVTGLLFAQWPLRDLVHAGSTQANDLAQWLFALYVAVAITHAQRRGAHLVARPDIDNTAASSPAWRRLGAPLALLAWSLFMFGTSAATTGRSLLGLERFPESLSPGYFFIKLALSLLALLVAAQALVDVRRAWRAGH
jgi:TRAP-type C4-dicarboxylate transport system permease small subunit